MNTNDRSPRDQELAALRKEIARLRDDRDLEKRMRKDADDLATNERARADAAERERDRLREALVALSRYTLDDGEQVANVDTDGAWVLWADVQRVAVSGSQGEGAGRQGAFVSLPEAAINGTGTT